MKYIINSYNTTSAGTMNVSINIIKGLDKYITDNAIKDTFYFFLPAKEGFRKIMLKNKDKLCLVYFPAPNGIFKILYRLFYDLIFLPCFVLMKNPASVFIVANYSPIPFLAKKVVLLRHPYIVDEVIFKNAKRKTKLIEKIRRFLFSITLNSVDSLIVQSEYMKSLLSKKYSNKIRRRNINLYVLPNPISSILLEKKDGSTKSLSNTKIVLYVSRYYLHKNHIFILKIVRKYSKELRKKNIKFYVTINPDTHKDAPKFLENVLKNKINDIILNINELSQDELMDYYKKASCLFFPSKSETFGNPLVEAMVYGLPVIAPDLTYAHAVCGEAGIYYKEEDVDDAYKHLVEICENEILWGKYSKKSITQSKRFPTVDEWTKRILGILKDFQKN